MHQRSKYRPPAPRSSGLSTATTLSPKTQVLRSRLKRRTLLQLITHLEDERPITFYAGMISCIFLFGLYLGKFISSFDEQANFVRTWQRITDAALDPVAREDLRSCRINDCNLQDSQWGVPTILISFGRSGSSSTWQLMTSMTGNYTPKAVEETGSDLYQTEDFFNSLDPTEGGKCWIQRSLCSYQLKNRMRRERELPMPGQFGFKWKPYMFGNNKSVEALQWLSRNPNIKVIHNQRDPFDVIVSRSKHNQTTTSLKAHCMMGDEECKEMHKKAKPTLNVTGLVNQIKQLEEEINEVDQLLDDHSVPHVDVSYERLYNVQDIALEWRRVFSFIGVGPSADQLTSADLVAHMEHAATSNSSASLRAKIQNYEEVVETLQGTKYEAYLYPAFLDPRKAFDVKFLGQVIGTGHRICVDGSGRESSRKRLNCWISPQIENENINGPMPLYVRPWMAEIFQTSSVLVFVSSHSSFASTSHEDIRIIAAEKTIVGSSTHYDETIWKVLNVTLRFDSHACKSLHSPSIAVDDENQRLYMYIHGHRCDSLGNNIQPTLVFSSEDGINWSTPTASSQRDPFVFRDLFYMSVPVFYDGHYFSIAKRGGSTVLCRGASLLGPWEQGQVLNEGTRHVRHGDIHVRGNHLYVFFTMIGDSPERIVLGDIYMSHALDWKDWKLHLGPILFEPEYYHEHGSAELKMSEMGPAKGILRQLRDPHFLSDKESPKDYLNGLLFYAAQGEQGIAIARISLCTSKYQNAVKQKPGNSQHW